MSELEFLFPQIAERARQKYVGREWLPQTVIPTLGCRWMDAVMFIPVHPEQVRDALVAAGHGHFPRHWIEIDAEQLRPDRTAIFLPGESLADDEFVPFDLETLAGHAQLCFAQRQAYAQGEPGKVLLFGHTAHVLHHGCVPFERSRILTV